jgi:hypothetical protein
MLLTSAMFYGNFAEIWIEYCTTQVRSDYQGLIKGIQSNMVLINERS